MTDLAGTTRACIYCKQARPFTDEHLFPKGLGGDDRRFMLKNLVCGYCNTTVFSKLEASFMRASPVALARIFMQKVKGSGRDAIVPRLDTVSTTAFIPGQGEVEAEMQAEGTATTLLQILFLGDGKCSLTGSDESHIPKFVGALRLVLDHTVILVRKVTTASNPSFIVTSYLRQSNRYIVGGSRTVPRPPDVCIWHEQFPTIGQEQRIQRHPTLFRRTAGQLVLRTHLNSDVCALLSEARAALDTFDDEQHIASTTVENPSMLFSMSMDTDAFGRVLTKIGLNLVAHLFGEGYMRDSAFDTAKAAVLGTMTDGAMYESVDETDSLRNSSTGSPRIVTR